MFAAALYVGICWYVISTNARRWIRIDDEFLRVGRREPVPLEAVDGFGMLTGRPLRRLRSRLFWGSPSSGRTVALQGLAASVGAWRAPAVPTVRGAGAYSPAAAVSRYGLACPFWARFGLAVHAPCEPAPATSRWRYWWLRPREMPDLWLIATRRPDEFSEMLQQACVARRATLRLTEAVSEQPA